MKKITVLFLTVVIFVTFAVPHSFGQRVESKTEESVQPQVHKLTRGIVNMGTAPFEIPKQMVKKAQEGNSVAGEFAGYLTGIVTGIGWGFCRFGSGMVDVISAPFPGNEKGLIKPEFITDEKILDDRK